MCHNCSLPTCCRVVRGSHSVLGGLGVIISLNCATRNNSLSTTITTWVSQTSPWWSARTTCWTRSGPPTPTLILGRDSLERLAFRGHKLECSAECRYKPMSVKYLCVARRCLESHLRSIYLMSTNDLMSYQHSRKHTTGPLLTNSGAPNSDDPRWS